MTNYPGNQSRRQCDKEERRSLTECYEGIKDQLTALNGKVQQHDGWFSKLIKRVKVLEDAEIHEEGVKEGEQSKSIITRSNIVIAIMLAGCLFAGIAVSQTSQRIAISKLASGKIPAGDNNKMTNIENALIQITNLLKKERPGG